jgi:hypothetical protein
LQPAPGVEDSQPDVSEGPKLGHRQTPAAALNPAWLSSSSYSVSATSNGASFAQKSPSCRNLGFHGIEVERDRCLHRRIPRRKSCADRRGFLFAIKKD